MNLIFSCSSYGNEQWLYQIPSLSQTEELRNLFENKLTEQQSEIMIGHFQEAYRLKKEVILCAVFKKDQKVKCLFEIYHISHHVCTIGYRCLFPERNRHYTSRSMSGMLAYLETCGFSTIYASCLNTNIPSILILEHHGFQMTGESDGKREYCMKFNSDFTDRVYDLEGI